MALRIETIAYHSGGNATMGMSQVFKISNIFHYIYSIPLNFAVMKKIKSLFSAATMLLLIISNVCAQPFDVDKLKNMKARSIGPAGMSGRVTAIDAVVSNPSIIYVGTASGGVWKSTSGGTEWEPVFDDQDVLNVGAIAVTQNNPDVIWVGTGEGNPRNSVNLGEGIYKSLDAGKTWELMGLEKTCNIHRILIDPRDENRVYVGAIGNPWADSDRGVFRTTDGGKTWERILFVDQRTGVADLVMDPKNPNKLMAAMWEHRRMPWTFAAFRRASPPTMRRYRARGASRTRWTTA